MAFGPTLPQTNAPIVSAELRGQFVALKGLIDGLPTSISMANVLSMQTAGSAQDVDLAPMPSSNPPSTADMQAIVNKLNELINALNRR
jgi:hypothetical protein